MDNFSGLLWWTEYLLEEIVPEDHAYHFQCIVLPYSPVRKLSELI